MIIFYVLMIVGLVLLILFDILIFLVFRFQTLWKEKMKS